MLFYILHPCCFYLSTVVWGKLTAMDRGVLLQLICGLAYGLFSCMVNLFFAIQIQCAHTKVHNNKQTGHVSYGAELLLLTRRVEKKATCFVLSRWIDL